MSARMNRSVERASMFHAAFFGKPNHGIGIMHVKMRLLVNNMHDDLDKITCMIKLLSKAGVAELVDAPDSGSGS